MWLGLAQQTPAKHTKIWPRAPGGAWGQTPHTPHRGACNTWARKNTSGSTIHASCHCAWQLAELACHDAPAAFWRPGTWHVAAWHLCSAGHSSGEHSGRPGSQRLCRPRPESFLVIGDIWYQVQTCPNNFGSHDSHALERAGCGFGSTSSSNWIRGTKWKASLLPPLSGWTCKARLLKACLISSRCRRWTCNLFRHLCCSFVGRRLFRICSLHYIFMYPVCWVMLAANRVDFSKTFCRKATPWVAALDTCKAS